MKQLIPFIHAACPSKAISPYVFVVTGKRINVCLQIYAYLSCVSVKKHWVLILVWFRFVVYSPDILLISDIIFLSTADVLASDFTLLS